MANSQPTREDTTPAKNESIFLPVELLTDSLSYFATWPTLHNLRNCCSLTRAIMDKRSKSNLTFNTRLYSKLNSSVAPTNQMHYLLNDCGLVFQRLTIACCPGQHPNELLSFVRMLLIVQSGQLTELVMADTNPAESEHDWYQLYEQIIDLIAQCSSLQTLKLPFFGSITSNERALNLSSLGSLKVLHGRLFQFGGCMAQLKELELRGRSVRGGEANPTMQRADFEQLLNVVAPTLERVCFVRCSLDDRNAKVEKKTFLFPKLKWLMMHNSDIAPIKLDISKSGDLEHFDVSCIENDLYTIAGFNPNKHKLKHFELGSDWDGLFYPKWYDADADKFEMLEVLVVRDRVPIDWFECGVKKLSYHCSRLSSLYVRLARRDDGSESMLPDEDSLVRLVSNAYNLKHLDLGGTNIDAGSLMILVHATCKRVANQHYFELCTFHGRNSSEGCSIRFGRVVDATVEEFCNRLVQVLDNDPMIAKRRYNIDVKARFSDGSRVGRTNLVWHTKLKDIGINVKFPSLPCGYSL